MNFYAADRRSRFLAANGNLTGKYKYLAHPISAPSAGIIKRHIIEFASVCVCEWVSVCVCVCVVCGAWCTVRELVGRNTEPIYFYSSIYTQQDSSSCVPRWTHAIFLTIAQFPTLVKILTVYPIPICLEHGCSLPYPSHCPAWIDFSIAVKWTLVANSIRRYYTPQYTPQTLHKLNSLTPTVPNQSGLYTWITKCPKCYQFSYSFCLPPASGAVTAARCRYKLSLGSQTLFNNSTAIYRLKYILPKYCHLYDKSLNDLPTIDLSRNLFKYAELSYKKST